MKLRTRTYLQLGATTLAAAVVGVLLLKPVLGLLMERNSIHNGPWRTSADTGSAAADPWTRAAVAIAGLYALSREEAVYYTAFTDSAGDTLRGECRYRISGTPPPARWWSLTVYGADHYLVPNTANRYAINAGNFRPDALGRMQIALIAEAVGTAQADALPIPAQGPYSLTLRLYNPPPSLAAQLASVPLPTIQREACS